MLALLGENGAGKSTLMKILSGVYKKDSGKVIIEEAEVEIQGIKHAEGLGITIIHQELSVLPNLTVYENIFLGNEKSSKGTRRINKALMKERSKSFLDQIGCNSRFKTYKEIIESRVKNPGFLQNMSLN